MKRLLYTDEKVDNRIFLKVIGFQPSYGWMLLDETAKTIVVFLDGRYITKDVHVGGRTITKVLLDKKMTTLLAKYILPGEELVLEKQIPWGVQDYLHKSDLDVQRMFDDECWQQHQRMHKSLQERAYTRQAISLTHRIWEWLSILARTGALVGKTELELRGLIVEKAYSLGLEGEAFDTIVATGKNSAIPHHQTGRTVIGPGPILIDMGFVWHGWCSDFTRVIWLDDTSVGAKNLSPLQEEFEKVVQTVRKAHDTAQSLVKSGVAFKDIAAAARKVIADAGYGEYFTHSLGHGVGLDIHEAPNVSIKSTDIIESGMIFTIEPGIYLPGKFGVRWENIVIVE